MIRVNLEDARLRLPELVAAALRGEEVEIAPEDGPAVRLVPVAPERPRRRAGSAKGAILYMAEDFDAPLEAFREYME